MKNTLISTCGLNCALCQAFLREKNQCHGCRFIENEKSPENNKTYCQKCLIRNCPTIKEKKLPYCSTRCESFPCPRLKNLAKRYSSKYDVDLLDNLEFIEKNGIRAFVRKEKKKYQKNEKTFCIHNKKWYSKL